MSEDPLEKPKREIEEEQGLNSYPAQIPTAHIELDRKSVPRGENLSGVVVIRAGMKDLWLDRLDMFVAGVAKSAGSPHTSTTFLVTRHVSVSAGKSRRFPVWVAVPHHTPLGPKLLMLKGAPATAAQLFEVEPERHYIDAARTLAEATGMMVQTWDVGRSGKGVFARIQPTAGETPPLARVGLEMCLQGDELVGTLIIDAPCVTLAATLRSLVRPSRQRIPFCIAADEGSVSKVLVLLLQSHLRRDRQLPLPASEGRNIASSVELPIPSEEPE